MFATADILQKDSNVVRPMASLDRAVFLARYRRLREIGKNHHSAMLDFVSKSAMMTQAQRLGLVQGKTLVLNDMDEMNLVFDLLFYTAQKDRSRSVDRYARSVQSTLNNDEKLVLEAMRRDRFSIITPIRRHDVAGLVVEDVFRGSEYWLVDEGFEKSFQEGMMLATRLYALEGFTMTAGSGVLLGVDLINQVLADTPLLRRKKPNEAINDRRFAEAIYRAAIESGATENITFQDLPIEAS
ncbi:MAG: hypothetical protein AAFR90_14745 [Pseudomonadota bacterium]